MPDSETLERLKGRELETLQLLLRTKAFKSTITIQEYISVRIAQGASQESIREVLLTDLQQGGRIFGEFRRAIKATSVGAVNRTRDNVEFAEFGVITSYRWAAVLINTCPDCLDRHGIVKTWEQWEADGLPRTGQTVCKENCRCMLLPADTTELEPVKRRKKKK